MAPRRGTLVNALSGAYGRLVAGLAALGAASLAFATLAIVVDVTLRNIGQRPLQWSSAVVEYVMLFTTMAGSPWLVRTHGHVSVGSLVASLPGRARRAVGVAVHAACAAIAAFVAWRAVLLGLDAHATGAADIRSIVIPGAVPYVMLACGFALMAVEFARLVARGEVTSTGAGMHA